MVTLFSKLNQTLGPKLAKHFFSSHESKIRMYSRTFQTKDAFARSVGCSSTKSLVVPVPKYSLCSCFVPVTTAQRYNGPEMQTWKRYGNALGTPKAFQIHYTGEKPPTSGALRLSVRSTRDLSTVSTGNLNTESKICKKRLNKLSNGFNKVEPLRGFFLQYLLLQKNGFLFSAGIYKLPIKQPNLRVGRFATKFKLNSQFGDYQYAYPYLFVPTPKGEQSFYSKAIEQETSKSQLNSNGIEIKERISQVRPQGATAFARPRQITLLSQEQNLFKVSKNIDSKIRRKSFARPGHKILSCARPFFCYWLLPFFGFINYSSEQTGSQLVLLPNNISISSSTRAKQSQPITSSFVQRNSPEGLLYRPSINLLSNSDQSIYLLNSPVQFQFPTKTRDYSLIKCSESAPNSEQVLILGETGSKDLKKEYLSLSSSLFAKTRNLTKELTSNFVGSGKDHQCVLDSNSAFDLAKTKSVIAKIEATTFTRNQELLENRSSGFYSLIRNGFLPALLRSNRSFVPPSLVPQRYKPSGESLRPLGQTKKIDPKIDSLVKSQILPIDSISSSALTLGREGELPGVYQSSGMGLIQAMLHYRNLAPAKKIEHGIPRLPVKLSGHKFEFCFNKTGVSRRDTPGKCELRERSRTDERSEYLSHYALARPVFSFIKASSLLDDFIKQKHTLGKINMERAEQRDFNEHRVNKGIFKANSISNITQFSESSNEKTYIQKLTKNDYSFLIIQSLKNSLNKRINSLLLNLKPEIIGRRKYSPQYQIMTAKHSFDSKKEHEPSLRLSEQAQRIMYFAQDTSNLGEVLRRASNFISSKATLYGASGPHINGLSPGVDDPQKAHNTMSWYVSHNKFSLFSSPILMYFSDINTAGRSTVSKISGTFELSSLISFPWVQMSKPSFYGSSIEKPYINKNLELPENRFSSDEYSKKNSAFVQKYNINLTNKKRVKLSLAGQRGIVQLSSEKNRYIAAEDIPRVLLQSNRSLVPKVEDSPPLAPQIYKPSGEGQTKHEILESAARRIRFAGLSYSYFSTYLNSLKTKLTNYVLFNNNKSSYYLRSSFQNRHQILLVNKKSKPIKFVKYKTFALEKLLRGFFSIKQTRNHEVYSRASRSIRGEPSSQSLLNRSKFKKALSLNILKNKLLVVSVKYSKKSEIKKSLPNYKVSHLKLKQRENRPYSLRQDSGLFSNEYRVRFSRPTTLILKNRSFLTKNISLISFGNEQVHQGTLKGSEAGLSLATARERMLTERARNNKNFLNVQKNNIKTITRRKVDLLKRRKKKQKKETRRRKKRKRIAPRPYWIRSKIYYSFLKKQKTYKNDWSPNARAGRAKLVTLLYSSPQANIEYISGHPYTKQKLHQKTTHPYIMSLWANKELYTVSRPVLGDLKRILWKSYWLRSIAFGPYLNGMKTNLTKIKESKKLWHFYTILQTFITLFLGPDALVSFPFTYFGFNFGSEQPLEIHREKPDARLAFTGPASGTLPSNVKNNSFLSIYTPAPKLNRYFYNSFGNSNFYNTFSAWQSAINLAEYNRLVYERIQHFILSIRENLNMSGKIKTIPYNVGRHKLISNPPVKDFWLKIGKILTFEVQQKPIPFYYGNVRFAHPGALAERTIGLFSSGKPRLYWTLAKTNNGINKISRRKQLWAECSKLREQTKTNKTKKLFAKSKNLFHKFIEKDLIAQSVIDQQDSRDSLKFSSKEIIFSIKNKIRKKEEKFENLMGVSPLKQKITDDDDIGVRGAQSFQVSLAHQKILRHEIQKNWPRLRALSWWNACANNTDRIRPLFPTSNRRAEIVSISRDLNAIDQSNRAFKISQRFKALGNNPNNYMDYNVTRNSIFNGIMLEQTNLSQIESSMALLWQRHSNAMNLQNEQAASVRHAWTSDMTSGWGQETSLSILSTNLGQNARYYLWIYSFIFHFCCIVSLISISQIRSLIKLCFIGFSKIYKASISAASTFNYSFRSFAKTSQATSSLQFTRSERRLSTIGILNSQSGPSEPLGSIRQWSQTAKQLSQAQENSEAISVRTSMFTLQRSKTSLLNRKLSEVTINELTNKGRVERTTAFQPLANKRELVLLDNSSRPSTLDFPIKLEELSEIFYYTIYLTSTIIRVPTRALYSISSNKQIFEKTSYPLEQSGPVSPAQEELLRSKSSLAVPFAKQGGPYAALPIHQKLSPQISDILQKQKSLVTQGRTYNDVLSFGILNFSQFIFQISSLVYKGAKRGTYTARDSVQTLIGSVSTFLSRTSGGEFILDWIAYIFLVEWSADLSATIPENFFNSFYITTMKFSRSIYCLNFYRFLYGNIESILLPNTLKSTSEASTVMKLLLNQNSYQNLQFSSSRFNEFKNDGHINYSSISIQIERIFSITLDLITNLVYSVISYSFASQFFQRRIRESYEIFIEKTLAPDTDLLTRQKKGLIFWDIWADNLKIVAEDSSINISELTSLKEEQIKLLEKLQSLDTLVSEKNSELAPKVRRIRSNKNTIISTFQNAVIYSLRSTQAQRPRVSALSGDRVPLKVGFADEPIRELYPFASSKEGKVITSFLNYPHRKSGETHALSIQKFYKQKPMSRVSEDLLNFIDHSGFMQVKINKPKLAHKGKRIRASWDANQSFFYQAGAFAAFSDLFIDLHPPKSFAQLNATYSLRASSTLQQPIGSIVCQIFSGIFTKQISRNLLIVGASGNEKSLLIQAIAGETELKIITDNAYRYSIVYQGVAVGIKLLRDVFDALALHTPCLFLLEDIHAIGERRPFLISDDENTKATESSFSSSNQTGLDEKNQIIYQLSKHVITHYQKPYRGDFSLLIPTNHFCFSLYSQRSSSAQTRKRNTFGPTNTMVTQTSEAVVNDSNSQLSSNTSSIMLQSNQGGTQNKRGSIYASSLQLTSNQLLAPPSTSPFSVFIKKEEKKFRPQEVVREMPWSGFPGEQYSLLNKASYSIRVKVALLADMAISNLSVKLDMITDLLVIIDSVKGNRGFVVFATTHPSALASLDPALRRPGRLDETIFVPLAVNSMIAGGPASEGTTWGLTSNLLSRWEILKTNSPFGRAGAGLARPGNIEATIDFSQTRITSYNTNLPMDNILFGTHFSLSNTNNLQFYKQMFNWVVSSPISSIPARQTINRKIRLEQKRIKKKKNKESCVPSKSLKTYQTLLSRSYFIVSQFMALARQRKSITSKLLMNRTYIKKGTATKGLMCKPQTLHENLTKNAGSLLVDFELMDNTSQNQPKSLFAILYSPPSLFQKYLIAFMAGKIGELFFFNTHFVRTWSSKDDSILFHNHLNSGLHRSTTLYGIDKTWRYLTSFVMQFIQKRYLYNQKLAGTLRSNLLFGNNSSLYEPPSPPITSILLPAKRSLNYKRSFYNQQTKVLNLSNGKMLTSNITINEKILLHQQQRLVKRLYGVPVKEYFRSETIANRLTSFGNSAILFGQKNASEANVQKPTSVNWFYRNRILNRHRNYLTNQWWNGQLPEHNKETTLGSDIDWRYNFVESLGDVFIDFPDSFQYYNPRNRRWVLTSGSWNFWYDYSQFILGDIYYNFIFDSFVKAYNILNENREMLDFYASTVLNSGLSVDMESAINPSFDTLALPEEIHLLKGIKRFYFE